ncbi:MAG: hypothetical protein R2710_00630 [Acidimicrobiales bacterium]
MVLSNTQAGVGGTAIFAAYLTGVIVVTLVSGAVEPVTILRSGLPSPASAWC